MKCSLCGQNNAVYYKDDCIVVSEFNSSNQWKETRMLCHECALRWPIFLLNGMYAHEMEFQANTSE